MRLDTIEIPATGKTPLVVLDPNGTVLIKGRSIPEDASGFYDGLLDWSSQYRDHPALKTTVIIMLEYVNDGSMKYLIKMLRNLVKVSDSGLDTEVRWEYEDFDDDMKELGEHLAQCIDYPVRLISIDKASN